MEPSVIDQMREWTAKARTLEPAVARWRDDCERERRIVPPLFEVLRDAGLLRLTSPKHYGGEEVSLRTAMVVIEDVARQDGAAGWNVMISSHLCFFADYLTPAAASTIFTPGASFAGNLLGGSNATSVPGGYRVSGRWPFSSGCNNAQWAVGTAAVVEDGKPRLGASGVPERIIVFAPMTECAILDTRHTAGLRGTGSNDVQATDVFVPRERCFPFAEIIHGPANTNAAYPFPFFQLAPVTIAAVALGIARDAIESFKALATAKTAARASVRLADHHTVQQRVGRAEALLRSARAYLFQTADDLVSKPHDQHWTHDEATASALLAGTFATQCAIDAVDLMYDAGGGTSIYATSRLERCFRDVHMVNHHLAVSPTNVEMAGHHLLGLGFQLRR